MWSRRRVFQRPPGGGPAFEARISAVLEWLPFVEAFRTMCRVPMAALHVRFEQLPMFLPLLNARQS
jgi:hypothetical protein